MKIPDAALDCGALRCAVRRPGSDGILGVHVAIAVVSAAFKAEDQSKILSLQLAQANSSLADLKGHVEVTEEKVHMTQSELAQARSRANRFARNRWLRRKS